MSTDDPHDRVMQTIDGAGSGWIQWINRRHSCPGNVHGNSLHAALLDPVHRFRFRSAAEVAAAIWQSSPNTIAAKCETKAELFLQMKAIQPLAGPIPPEHT